MKSLKILNNQSGIIALDFLFAFVLIMGFSSLMLALSLTLSIVEITQYITFASARNYYSSTENVGASAVSQESAALAKYTQLTSHPTLAPFYRNGWFEIENVPQLGEELIARNPQYDTGPDSPSTFIGAGTNFNARVLDFRIPFFGSTVKENTEGRGFATFIASYLGREPTIAECYNQSIQRWQRIRRLPSSVTDYQANTTENGYLTIVDNGC